MQIFHEVFQKHVNIVIIIDHLIMAALNTLVGIFDICRIVWTKICISDMCVKYIE